jgi:hypothetical protein
MPFDIKTQLRVQYEVTSGTWVSVEADTFEVDIDRGIEVEQGVFARPMVGTATVRMIKSSLADFMNGPAYQSNQRIRIEYQLPSTSWVSLFTGYIQNIEMGYVASAKASGSALTRGKLQVTLTAYDMGRIALNTQISLFSISGTSARSFINVMGQLATAIDAIDSRYSQQQTLSGGSSTYQHAYDYQDIASGELYAQFLDAELGWLWASRDGFMYFHTRADVNTIQSQTWSSSNLTVSNVHTTDPKHVCMDNIELAYDSDSISNVVAVTETFNQTKTTQTNSTSVTNYGRQVGRFEVNFNPASPSSTLAQWASAVATAANPKSITSVSVPVILDSGEVSEIAQSEVGSALQVEFAQTGFTTLQELYMISRINHMITAEHWEMNVGLWRGI